MGAACARKYLKAPGAEPFSLAMSAISSSMFSQRWEVTVAKKQLDAVEQQGKDALALIEAASAPQASQPPVNAAPGVGAQLNIVA